MVTSSNPPEFTLGIMLFYLGEGEKIHLEKNRGFPLSQPNLDCHSNFCWLLFHAGQLINKAKSSLACYRFHQSVLVKPLSFSKNKKAKSYCRRRGFFLSPAQCVFCEVNAILGSR